MKDKSHCKVNVEYGAQDLTTFYDFNKKYENDRVAAIRQEDAFGWVGSSHQWGVVSVGNELVLPNGNRLGHRSLAKFCKQKYEHMSHGANTRQNKQK